MKYPSLNVNDPTSKLSLLFEKSWDPQVLLFQKLLCARSHCTSIQGRKWVGKLQPSKLVMVSQFDVKSVPLFSAYDMGRAGKFHEKIPMKDVRV